MGSHDLAIVIVMTASFVAAAFVVVMRGPFGRAWARRIEGTGGAVDGVTLADMQGRIAELEGRLEQLPELEGQLGHLHELEERLDFAERLLAQGREQPHRIEEAQ